MNWLFQYNPKLFSPADVFKGSTGKDDWAMNQRRKDVSPGDRVYLWQTGPEAQLVATAHVISPVYEKEGPFGRYYVDIQLDTRIAPPITRPEVLENTILSKFAPFRGAMGTNFIIPDEVAAELDRVLEGRTAPVANSFSSPPNRHATQETLDTAIKNAERDVRNALREHISQMDPIAFEWLIRALLIKLGYQKVEVTKQSGDGGIDIRAVLVAGGIAHIKTCIQAKRQQSVGRPVVQGLRGSLSAHEAGLLVTSGTFTSQAVEDASDPHRAPIMLLDGTKLAQLLIDKQLGVEHGHLTLYRLKLEDLSVDNLTSRPELEDQSDPVLSK
ncbi:MAG: restriction endonuclease [Alphaproteobacteria bacterium]